MKILYLYWLPFLSSIWFGMAPDAVLAQPLQVQATLLQQFNSDDARQGIAVDNDHFFTISNTRISMHDKNSGEPILKFNAYSKAGSSQLIHLDSGKVLDGLLYAAHSNYPRSPMQSSVESLNATTPEHVESHPFGPIAGSLTCLDFHQGHWWGTFANYDVIDQDSSKPMALQLPPGWSKWIRILLFCNAGCFPLPFMNAFPL